MGKPSKYWKQSNNSLDNMMTAILLIILSGAILEMGILKHYSKCYTYYDYRHFQKHSFLFWAILSVSLYGYYQEPFPLLIPINKFSLKVVYHGFVVLGFITWVH